jgi:hypothetical protein
MESVSYRVLRNEPGKFEETLNREGIVILNKSGKPIAVVLKTTSDSVEAALRLVSLVRAQMAVSEMRSSARERSLDQLTSEEIQAVIDEVRSSRPA